MTSGMCALITGASGLLGWWLGKVLQERGWEVWGGFRSKPAESWRWGKTVPLDLTSRSSIEGAMATANPEVIFHLGALTDMDRCAAEPVLARQVNVLGSRLIGKAAAQLGARLCYVSTDHVFDGHESPFTESSPPNPVSVYGETKRAGEATLRFESPASLIIRSTHYGLHPERPTSLSHLLQSLRDGRSVPMRADHWFTPLSSLTLAETLADLAPDEDGLRHLPGQPISHLNWALAVAAEIGADPALVQPVGEIKPRQWTPDQAGRFTRPEPARHWSPPASSSGSHGATRAHDTRLETEFEWTPPSVEADLKRMLDAYDGAGKP